jgi:HECT-domain (ubiquitin-transferase)
MFARLMMEQDSGTIIPAAVPAGSSQNVQIVRLPALPPPDSELAMIAALTSNPLLTEFNDELWIWENSESAHWKSVLESLDRRIDGIDKNTAISDIVKYLKLYECIKRNAVKGFSMSIIDKMVTFLQHPNPIVVCSAARVLRVTLFTSGSFKMKEHKISDSVIDAVKQLTLGVSGDAIKLLEGGIKSKETSDDVFYKQASRFIAVEVMIRLMSDHFTSTYFQVFPSFLADLISLCCSIMELPELSNALMFLVTAGMHLLASLVSESSSFTAQTLSLLGATIENGPLFYLLNRCIEFGAKIIQNRQQQTPTEGIEFRMICAVLRLTSTSIQSAQYPHLVASPVLLRLLMNVFIDPIWPFTVITAVNHSLEVSAEVPGPQQQYLFRDLKAVDLICKRLRQLSESQSPDTSISPLTSRLQGSPIEKVSRSICMLLSFLRSAFVTAEELVHLGVLNFHEQLSNTGDLKQVLLICLGTNKHSVPDSVKNSCLWLLESLVTEDPTVSSDLMDSGLLDVIYLNLDGLLYRNADAAIAVSGIYSLVMIHDRVYKYLSDKYTSLISNIITNIVSDKYEITKYYSNHKKSDMEYSDYGTGIGRMIQDLCSNKPNIQGIVVKAILDGFKMIMDKATLEIIVPGCRILSAIIQNMNTSMDISTYMEIVTCMISVMNALDEQLVCNMIDGMTLHPIIMLFKHINGVKEIQNDKYLPGLLLLKELTNSNHIWVYRVVVEIFRNTGNTGIHQCLVNGLQDITGNAFKMLTTMNAPPTATATTNSEKVFLSATTRLPTGGISWTSTISQTANAKNNTGKYTTLIKYIQWLSMMVSCNTSSCPVIANHQQYLVSSGSVMDSILPGLLSIQDPRMFVDVLYSLLTISPNTGISLPKSVNKTVARIPVLTMLIANITQIHAHVSTMVDNGLGDHQQTRICQLALTKLRDLHVLVPQDIGALPVEELIVGCIALFAPMIGEVTGNGHLLFKGCLWSVALSGTNEEVNAVIKGKRESIDMIEIAKQSLVNDDISSDHSIIATILIETSQDVKSLLDQILAVGISQCSEALKYTLLQILGTRKVSVMEGYDIDQIIQDILGHIKIQKYYYQSLTYLLESSTNNKSSSLTVWKWLNDKTSQEGSLPVYKGGILLLKRLLLDMDVCKVFDFRIFTKFNRHQGKGNNSGDNSHVSFLSEYKSNIGSICERYIESWNDELKMVGVYHTLRASCSGNTSRTLSDILTKNTAITELAIRSPNTIAQGLVKYTEMVNGREGVIKFRTDVADPDIIVPKYISETVSYLLGEVIASISEDSLLSVESILAIVRCILEIIPPCMSAKEGEDISVYMDILRPLLNKVSNQKVDKLIYPLYYSLAEYILSFKYPFLKVPGMKYVIERIREQRSVGSDEIEYYGGLLAVIASVPDATLEMQDMLLGVLSELQGKVKCETMMLLIDLATKPIEVKGAGDGDEDGEMSSGDDLDDDEEGEGSSSEVDSDMEMDDEFESGSRFVSEIHPMDEQPELIEEELVEREDEEVRDVESVVDEDDEDGFEEFVEEMGNSGTVSPDGMDIEFDSGSDSDDDDDGSGDDSEDSEEMSVAGGEAGDNLMSMYAHSEVRQVSDDDGDDIDMWDEETDDDEEETPPITTGPVFKRPVFTVSPSIAEAPKWSIEGIPVSSTSNEPLSAKDIAKIHSLIESLGGIPVKSVPENASSENEEGSEDEVEGEKDEDDDSDVGEDVGSGSSGSGGSSDSGESDDASESSQGPPELEGLAIAELPASVLEVANHIGISPQELLTATGIDPAVLAQIPEHMQADAIREALSASGADMEDGWSDESDSVNMDEIFSGGNHGDVVDAIVLGNRGVAQRLLRSDAVQITPHGNGFIVSAEADSEERRLLDSLLQNSRVFGGLDREGISSHRIDELPVEREPSMMGLVDDYISNIAGTKKSSSFEISPSPFGYQLKYAEGKPSDSVWQSKLKAYGEPGVIDRLATLASNKSSTISAYPDLIEYVLKSLFIKKNSYFRALIDRVILNLCLDDRVRPIILKSLYSALLCYSYKESQNVSFQPPLKGLLNDEMEEIDIEDATAAEEARSVGSGRVLKVFTSILSTCIRARSWFSIESPSNRGQPNAKMMRRGPVENAPIDVMIRILIDSDFFRSSPAHTNFLATVLINILMAGTIKADSVASGSAPSTAEDGPTEATGRERSDSINTNLTGLPSQSVTPAATLASYVKTVQKVVSASSISNLCSFLSRGRLENAKSVTRQPVEIEKALLKISSLLKELGEKDPRTKSVIESELILQSGVLMNELTDHLGVLATRLYKILQLLKELSKGEFESRVLQKLVVKEKLWESLETKLNNFDGVNFFPPSAAQIALQRRREAEAHSGVTSGGRHKRSNSEQQATNHATAPGTEEPESKKEPETTVQLPSELVVLIPLLEIYVLCHSNPKDLQKFLERHRRPINALVKHQPSLLSRSLQPLLKHCSSLLDFDNKRQYFRNQLKKQTDDNRSGPSRIPIKIRRPHVFIDSFHQLSHKDDLRGKLSVTFQGEEGIDAGGLVREWFGLVAREIFNPNYALFLPCSGRPSTFVINANSGVNPDHLSFFRFCGKLVGKAIFDNQRLDCYFTRSFYKHMLGEQVNWQDLENLDPSLFKNLKLMLEHRLEDLGIFESFSAVEDRFGVKETVELTPGGNEIEVTDENKSEYVQLIAEYKMSHATKSQMDAFLQGFHFLVPKDLLGSLFDDKELELLISGLPSIDISDLKANTEYVGYSKDSDQIKWFWKTLENDFTDENLAQFLQFVTGSSQVPLEGFKGLAGMNGPQRFSIHKAFGNERLPTAHTCFNQLDLPEYQNEEQLKSKLIQAVTEAHQGFGFA